jgi:phage/plasmid-like protein (TIGR03299 family)
MSHEITATDNMFSVREMPWHRLGEVLEDYPTRAEAQAKVHGWEPVAQPLYRRIPSVDADGNLTSAYEEVEGYVAQERSDTGALIATTSTTYTTVTNDELWDVAEAIQDVPQGDVLYETGGSLGGGKKVWLMLRLAEPLIIPGDPNGATVPFYMLQNNHDGLGSFRGSATQIRAVCANTIRQADIDAQTRGTEFVFSHTKNVTERIEEARQALAGWRDSVEAYQQIAALMLGAKVSKRGEREFLERFIPAPPSFMTSDRVKTNIEEAREAVMAVYNSVTCEGIRGTAWGLMQAASEYSEHVRKANSMESRFRRALLEKNHIMTSAKVFALEAAGV